nr:MAG TPA: hypothetical protein [Caudoviricetes sp.]
MNDLCNSRYTLPIICISIVGCRGCYLFYIY